MSADIVTLLRELMYYGTFPDESVYGRAVLAAADEIERLREQNDYLSKAGDVMAEWVAVDHSVEQCEDGCEYLIALQDWKAVRGD